MRTVIELNKNWYFQKENVGLPQELPCDWAKVDLPHTWNAVDAVSYTHLGIRFRRFLVWIQAGVLFI